MTHIRQRHYCFKAVLFIMCLENVIQVLYMLLQSGYIKGPLCLSYNNRPSSGICNFRYQLPCSHVDMKQCVIVLNFASVTDQVFT